MAKKNQKVSNVVTEKNWLNKLKGASMTILVVVAAVLVTWVVSDFKNRKAVETPAPTVKVETIHIPVASLAVDDDGEYHITYLLNGELKVMDNIDPEDVAIKTSETYMNEPEITLKVKTTIDGDDADVERTLVKITMCSTQQVSRLTDGLLNI